MTDPSRVQDQAQIAVERLLKETLDLRQENERLQAELREFVVVNQVLVRDIKILGTRIQELEAVIADKVRIIGSFT